MHCYESGFGIFPNSLFPKFNPTDNRRLRKYPNVLAMIKAEIRLKSSSVLKVERDIPSTLNFQSEF